MSTVLIATQKPFDASVRDEMVARLKQGGLDARVLENYSSQHELMSALQGVQGIIVRSDTIDKAVLDASNLEIAVRAGAGYETIDHKYAESKGVVVETTPGQNANGVAEEAIGMMISLARNLHVGDAGMKEGRFLASQLAGYELKGKRLGIHGFGNVGQLVAKKASALGLEVYAFDVMMKDQEIAKECGATLVSSVQDVYKKMDFVSLHIPENAKTKGMVNNNLLSLMNERSVLINTARPGIINYSDLAATLNDRSQFKYGSDVNKATFLKDQGLEAQRDRVLLIPKLGAQTEEANRNAGMQAAEQMILYFSQGRIINEVNNPLPIEMGEYARLAQNLGRFNQSFVSLPHRVEITVYGSALQKYREYIGHYVLKGLFQEELGRDVLPTEALQAANERKIELVFRNADPRIKNGDSIEVKYVNSSNSHSVCGRIDRNERQITQVGEFPTTIPIVPLEGVVVQYKEQKGMADKIGAYLTRAGYNKVHGGFRPNAEGTKAMTFYQVSPNGNVTQGISDIVCDQLSKMPGVRKAVYFNMR